MGKDQAANGLLKFITCGSVDDGKSTLIGHILYDTKLLYTDQEQALELDSKVGSRGGKLDYSLLLDGLMAEREQGITIDVAYRYFTTDRRSFIVADTPGHEEYTRNMAVGASFADLAVILVDASKGVLVQTRRHARICALMGIRSFVFAVNKMDLVDYSQARFQEIKEQIDQLREELGLENVKIIPLSATEGANVTTDSPEMPWYDGGALLAYLETVQVDSRSQEEGFYLPVQRVCRPDHTFRGFQGQIESGELAVGDQITVLPSGTQAGVKTILVGDRESQTAAAGQPVTVQLDREIDISRGCVLVKGTQLQVSNRIEAMLLWMDDETLSGSRTMFVKAGTQMIPGTITEIQYVVDVNTGEHRTARNLQKNEIARCVIELAQPIVVDLFSKHRTLGELILIDRLTNATSACGVIEQISSTQGEKEKEITPAIRAKHLGQSPLVILAHDAKAAGKIEGELLSRGLHTMFVQASGEQLIFAAELLWQAGLITILPGDRLDAGTEAGLREKMHGRALLDLREGGPAEDQSLYENMVNYSFY